MTTTAPPLRIANLAPLGLRSLAGVTVDLAHSRIDRWHALELHRNVYQRKGLLPESAQTPRVPPQACAPGSALLVAKESDQVLGTISFYMDSEIGLPMDDVHSEEVDAMRSRFARVAEVGGLAVREECRGLGITLALYQAALRWATATDAQCIVACVNPSSQRFYSKLLLFHVLGECKQHPRFLGAPSIPISLDLTTAPLRCREAYGSESEGYSVPFFCEAHPQHTFRDLEAAQYLQWSREEVLEMMERHSR